MNRLFTARSKQQFHLELTDAVVDSKVKDLNGKRNQEHTLPQRADVGIGAGTKYTLYDVGSDKTHFFAVGDVTKSRGRGSRNAFREMILKTAQVKVFLRFRYLDICLTFKVFYLAKFLIN